MVRAKLRVDFGLAQVPSCQSPGLFQPTSQRAARVYQPIEGVSRVRSTGVTRAHLNELFEIIYENRNNEADSKLTEGTLDGGTMARDLAASGLGEAAEIEELMFETGIYRYHQHGIGELDNNLMHEELVAQGAVLPMAHGVPC